MGEKIACHFQVVAEKEWVCTSLPSLLPTGWDADVMVGAVAAILGQIWMLHAEGDRVAHCRAAVPNFTPPDCYIADT